MNLPTGLTVSILTYNIIKFKMFVADLENHGFLCNVLEINKQNWKCFREMKYLKKIIPLLSARILPKFYNTQLQIVF